jgi:two-component system chemotaxis response regulator CheY
LKRKILVVDDSPSISSLLKDILSHHGYKVDVARDGETALQKYQTVRPDVVTLDLGMSDMDGYEVLSRLLDIDKHATVVIVTANPFATLEESTKIGAAGFVGKPFRKEQLLEAVEQALHKKINPVSDSN